MCVSMCIYAHSFGITTNLHHLAGASLCSPAVAANTVAAAAAIVMLNPRLIRTGMLAWGGASLRCAETCPKRPMYR